MSQRLTDLIVTEASLVDFPANEHARVLLWKRDEVDKGGAGSGNFGHSGRPGEGPGGSGAGGGGGGGRGPLTRFGSTEGEHRAKKVEEVATKSGYTPGRLTPSGQSTFNHPDGHRLTVSHNGEWSHQSAGEGISTHGLGAAELSSHLSTRGISEPTAREKAEAARDAKAGSPFSGRRDDTDRRALSAAKEHQRENAKKSQPDASDTHVNAPLGAMKMVPGKKKKPTKEAEDAMMTNKRLDELIAKIGAAVDKATSNNRPKNPDGEIDPEEHRGADETPEENREANNRTDLAPLGDEADEATLAHDEANVAPVHSAGEEGTSEGMIEYDEQHNVGYMEDEESEKWYLCNGDGKKIGGPFDGKQAAQAAYRSKIGKKDDGVSLVYKAGMPSDPSKYAYVPDKDHPSTWKLPIHDSTHASAAAAALSSGGFRGSKVQLPPAAKSAVKAKVRAAWMKFNPDKDTSDMPDSLKKSGFDELVETHAELGDEIRKAGAKISSTRLKRLKDVHRAVGEMIREQDPMYQAYPTGGQFMMTKKDEILKAKSSDKAAADDDEDEPDEDDTEARKRLINKIEGEVSVLKEEAGNVESESEEDVGNRFERIGKLEVRLAVLKGKMPPQFKKDKEEEEEEEARKRLQSIEDPKIRKYLSQIEKRAEETDVRVKKAEEQVAEAQAIAKEERDRRVTMELTEVAKGLSGLPGSVDEKVIRLRKLYTSLSKKDADAEVVELRKSSDLIRKSEVFKEIGSGGAGGGAGQSAADQLSALATARMSEVNKSAGAGSSISYAQAYDQILKENAGLYDQYRMEQKERALHS